MSMRNLQLALAAGIVCQTLWCWEAVSYLTFASAEPFTLSTSGATKGWNGIMYYSPDSTTWFEWDGHTIITSALCGVEHRIYVRGRGNTKVSSDTERWVLSGDKIRCDGNIENLLDYKVVLSGEHPTMETACYDSLFRGCVSLTTAPELPATSLSEGCYHGMFRECTSLTTAPELPATELAPFCYQRMFFGCTSLTTAPELPAAELMRYCYTLMFYECTSLTTAPELPAIVLSDNCYHGMFMKCASLISIPALPATELMLDCYCNMFSGCTKVKLSTEQTGEYQFPYRIPIDGIGTSSEDPGADMFSGTGGTFTYPTKINTTYYTSNTVI